LGSQTPIVAWFRTPIVEYLSVALGAFCEFVNAKRAEAGLELVDFEALVLQWTPPDMPLPDVALLAQNEIVLPPVVTGMTGPVEPTDA